MWIAKSSGATRRPNLLLKGLQGMFQCVKILMPLGLAGMLFVGIILYPPLWDESQGGSNAARDFEAVEPIYDLELSERDHLLILRTRRNILVRDLQSGDIIHRLPALPHMISSSKWIPRSQHLLLGYFSGQIALLDRRRSWEAIFTEQVHHDEIRSIAVCSEGRLAATGSSDRICLWDLECKKRLAEVPMHDAVPMTLQFSPNQDRLLAGCDNGRLHIFRTKDLQGLQTFKRAPIPISQAEFIDNGTKVLAGNLQGRIFALDSSTGEAVWDAVPCRLQLLEMAVSPDESFVALTDWTHAIHLYSLETFEKIDSFAGHQQGVSAVQFSRNHDWLYSASYDGTVRIWDRKTFAELSCFRATRPTPDD